MVQILVGAVLAISALPGADGRVATSLRAQRLSTQEAAGAGEKAKSQAFSSAEILASARVSTKTQARQPQLMDGISQMRAEMCAHQEHGVSDEHDECLDFMTKACNPGPDMLMNGTPGEISTGHGWCTQFFETNQLGANGIAASPAGAPGAPAGAQPALEINLGDVHAEQEVDVPAEEERQVMAAKDMEATMDEVGQLMKVRSATSDEKKEELAALYWYEDELNQKLSGLDEDEYCRKVQQEASLVGQETSAPGMAEMLAEMRCEMQQFSLPFYRKVVENNIEMVREQQKKLMLDIESGKKRTRTKTVEDDEKKAEVEEEVAPARPPEEESSSWRASILGGWEWWHVLLVFFIVACLAGTFFAGRRIREHREAA